MNDYKKTEYKKRDTKNSMAAERCEGERGWNGADGGHWFDEDTGKCYETLEEYYIIWIDQYYKGNISETNFDKMKDALE